MKMIVLLVALAVAPWAHADVFKCMVNGKPTYSDVPCATDAAKLNIAPAAQQESGPLAEAKRAAESAFFKNQARAQQSIAAGEVFIGMYEKDVLASWGRPSKINSDLYPSGKKEQWIYYKRGYKDAYVYLDNGVVTAIQQR